MLVCLVVCCHRCVVVDTSLGSCLVKHHLPYEHGFLYVPGRTYCFLMYDVEALWVRGHPVELLC